LKAPGTYLFTLKYDQLLSNFALKFKLRRYKLVCARARVYVDFNGAIIARHTPMRRFELQSHLGQVMLVETLETRVESAWF
jgi:hypothetical protein